MVEIFLWFLFAVLIPCIFTLKKGEFSITGVVLGTVFGTLVLYLF